MMGQPVLPAAPRTTIFVINTVEDTVEIGHARPRWSFVYGVGAPLYVSSTPIRASRCGLLLLVLGLYCRSSVYTDRVLQSDIRAS